MFFIFSKILIVLIRPLFWVSFLLIWAWFTKNQKRKSRFIIAAFVLLFLCSNKVLVNEMARAWETEPVSHPGKLPETAVILGGYAEWDQLRNRVQFSEASDRLFSPVRLFVSGQIRTFVLSGGAASLTGRTKPEADYVKPVLLGFGVPDSAILIENKSRNTHENAVFTKDLLKKHGITDTVLLVTSAFHMRRALAVFTKAGIPVKAYPVHFISDYGRGYFLPDWFLPSSEALFRFDALVKELIGYVVYDVTGKL